MINFTLMIDPNVLPFKIGAIHSFRLYHYILGLGVIQSSQGWERCAAILSHRGTYAETTMRVLNETDFSRPIVGDQQAPQTCILCAQGTPHTTRLHQHLMEAS